MSKEEAEAKRARKEHEMEGQFRNEGLQIPSFSGVAMNENMNFVQEGQLKVVNGQDQDDGEKKRKRQRKKEKGRKESKAR